MRIGGNFYECGAHEIDTALVDHWYLKALVKDGLAQIVEDPKPEPKPEPQPEAPKVAPKVEPEVKPAPVKPAAAKPAQKPVKRSGKK